MDVAQAGRSAYGAYESFRGGDNLGGGINAAFGILQAASGVGRGRALFKTARGPSKGYASGEAFNYPQLGATINAEGGYVSGFRQIMAKARLARAGGEAGEAAAAEIRAAKYLRSQGLNVHFQVPGAVRSGAGGTADLIVGGARRAGFGGMPYDVVSPSSPQVKAVFRAIRNKNGQAPGIIVDLSRTSVTRYDLGDIMFRLRQAGATNIQNVIFLP